MFELFKCTFVTPSLSQHWVPLRQPQYHWLVEYCISNIPYYGFYKRSFPRKSILNYLQLSIKGIWTCVKTQPFWVLVTALLLSKIKPKVMDFNYKKTYLNRSIISRFKVTSKIIKQLFTQFITNNTNIKIYTKQISILDWAWAWWFQTDYKLLVWSFCTI